MGSTFIELHAKGDEGLRAPADDGLEPMPYPGSGWTARIGHAFLDLAALRALARDASSRAGDFACGIGVWDSDRLALVLARNGEPLSELVYEAGLRAPAASAFEPWGALLEPKRLAEGLWLGPSFEATFPRLRKLQEAVELVALGRGVRVMLRDLSAGSALEAVLPLSP